MLVGQIAGRVNKVNKMNTIKINTRIMTIIIATLMIIALIAPLSSVDAATNSYKGLKYKSKGSNAKYGKGIYITSYKGSKSSVTIPKKINGKYVVSVDLDEEGLTSINVKKAIKLKHLDVSENRLKSLNVTKNKKLRKLDASENRLTKLTVKYNTRLVDLDASENKLTSIGLTKLTKLKELDLSDNKLTKLNVSKNLKLKELDIEGNKGLSWFNMSHLANHSYLEEVTFYDGSEWERD